MTYPYYGWPPPPPGYFQSAPEQASPAQLVAMIEGMEKTKSALKELLKEKKEEKKPRSYNDKQMLAFMAIAAFPVGFAMWSIILMLVAANLKALGVIP